MKRIVSPLLLAATALAVSVVEAGAQSVIINPDSSFSFELPDRYQPTSVNPEATLQFADTLRESFFLVIPESKEDLFGWNLVRHNRITVARLLVQTDFPELSGPEPLELDGHPAVRHTIAGAVQGVRISYLHTTIELPDQFLQVLAWTQQSKWDALLRELEEIVGSFRRLGDPLPAFRSDVFAIVPGAWAWDREGERCEGDDIQRFEISPAWDSMWIHHSEPYESDGEMRSVTPYVIEGYTPMVLHTFIPHETRLTDAGDPVRWDLVVAARNRLVWHRRDWPEGAMTRALRRCEAASDPDTEGRP